MNFDFLTILGPTASGKTKLATHLALSINGEIISADSRQVYKGMDIGTGKDLDDYVINNQPIPYYLIDIAEAGSQYHLFNYQQDFLKAFQTIKSHKKVPILCGGTGLYISAVTEPYHLSSSGINQTLRNQLNDKSLAEIQELAKTHGIRANKSDFENKVRLIRYLEIALSPSTQSHHFPSLSSIIFGIDIDSETLKKNIIHRLNERLQNGMLDEIKNLLQYIPQNTLLKYGLEYKYVTLFLLNQLSYEEMQQQLATAIYQFSRKQRSWFRRMERNGATIHWIDYTKSLDEKIQYILEEIQKKQ